MRVLVVESDIVASQRYARRLRADAFAVDEVSSLADGAWAVYEFDYDGVIVGDLGTVARIAAFLEEVRAERPDRSTMVVSVDADLHRRLALLEAGADDVMNGTISLDEMAIRVRKLLTSRIRPERDPGHQRFGRLAVHRGYREVLVDGESVALPPMQYSLLVCMLQNLDQVMTSEELTRRLWDRNRIFRTNPLRVNVCRLRTYLRGAVEIEAVPGVGYVMRLAPQGSEVPGPGS